MSDVLLRIGEFARLVQLPVRTVRYYGDIGLLTPSTIDPATGYRLYGLDRLEHTKRLVALKEIGLPLEEIGNVLKNALSPMQFRSLLESHVVELENDLAHTSRQLERAREHLDQLTYRLEQAMPDVTIKTTEPTHIVFIRETISGVEEIGPLFPRLFETIDPTVIIGVGGNVYHHFSEDGSNIDVEAMMPVPADYQPCGDAQTRSIDATQVASLMHHGSFNRLWEAHGALLQWVEDNGYVVSGPAYEWNVVCTEPVTQDNESYITEVQVEVTKAS